MSESQNQWLVDLYEEHGTSLHRLVVMLGAESESGHILRASLIGLSRRAHRLVDPLERVEFLAEEVVHDARSVRGQSGTLHLPEVADTRQQEILTGIASLPVRVGEVLVISHYLSVYGPELAGILRMTVRSANHRLEEALDTLRRDIGDPAPGSLPGAIESLSQEVTAALRSSARLVQPAGTDTLEAELRTLNDSDRRGVSLMVFVPLLVGALALGFWLAAATTPGVVVEAAPTTVPTAAPTASSSRSLPTQVNDVPIYYVGTDMMLFRELRDISAAGDLVRAAIEAILSVPPLDSDYDSLWGTGRLIDVEQTGHKLTLDMTGSVFEGLTTVTAVQAAVDQMVYTTSDLVGDPELRVFFKSDGGAPPALLRSVEGFGRSGLDPMPALWLSSPKNNARLVTGPLVIVGNVKPSATAPLVKITNEDGDVVSSTTAQTATDANAEGWRVWSVTVSLAPGTYILVASTNIEGSDGLLRSAAENKKITVS